MTLSLERKRQATFQRWTARLRQAFPSLYLPDVKNLALWSLGIVLAQSASLHQVALALAYWLSWKPATVRRRLQQWYCEAAAKKGHGSGVWGFQRRDWDPEEACADLLAWLIREWPQRQLVLALDPTNLGDRFTVLCISVLYRSCAVPVSWVIVEGNTPGAWEPLWERQLRRLATRLPAGWQILVLTDRGLYSPQLFRCVVELHWHPLLRIRAQGHYRPVGTRKWLKLENLRLKEGETRACEVELFKNTEGRLRCTLVAYRGAGYAEPWLLSTELSPEVARASWYRLRGWVEQGYKRVKSEGWDVAHTRILDPQRLSRHWLGVAVATLWVLEVGGEAEELDRAERRKPEEAALVGLPELGEVAASDAAEKSKEEAKGAHRTWSIFLRGWNLLREALIVGGLLLGAWYPEPWPDAPKQGLPATPVLSGGSAAVHPPPPSPRS